MLNMKTKIQSKVNQAPYEEREKNGIETFTDGVLHQTVSQKMKGRKRVVNRFLITSRFNLIF